MRFRREAAEPEADPARGIELRGVGHVYGERVVLDRRRPAADRAADRGHRRERVGEEHVRPAAQRAGAADAAARCSSTGWTPGRRCARCAAGWASCSRTRTRRSCTRPSPRTPPTGWRTRACRRPSGPTRVAEVLERYGLAGHADHPAHLLSGGQKQLLAIAGVLVMRPGPDRVRRAHDAARPGQHAAGGLGDRRAGAAGRRRHPRPGPARELRPGAGDRRAGGWSRTAPRAPPSPPTAR